MSWKNVDVWEMPLDDNVKRERFEPREREVSPDDDLISPVVRVRAEQIVRNMEVVR